MEQFFRLSTTSVDKSVHESLDCPIQSASLRARARLGETLINRKYSFEINILQKKKCGKCSGSRNCSKFGRGLVRLVYNRADMVLCGNPCAGPSTMRFVARY
jgi:hypothetical protein